MSETTTLQAGQKIRAKQTGQVYTVENFWPRMHPPITVIESDRMFDLQEVEVIEQPPTEPRAGESPRFKVGQRVFWNDPDAGLCSGWASIAEIKGDGDPDGLEDQIFVLTMEGGAGETEAVMSELSEVAPTNPRAQTATPHSPLPWSKGSDGVLRDRDGAAIYFKNGNDTLILSAVNQHTKLVAALRDLMTTAAALDNGLHAGFKVAELSTEQSRVYNAINEARAALANEPEGEGVR